MRGIGFQNARAIVLNRRGMILRHGKPWQGGSDEPYSADEAVGG